MKTLGQIENEVRSLTSAFTVMERTRGTGEGVHGIKAAQDRQDKLFASLAAWDAVLQECLPELRQEVKSLEWIQNACNEEDLSEDCGLSTTGLARLEYLRGILEEEAP